MRLKIALSATLLIILGGIYTVLGLPLVTKSAIYIYIDGYTFLVQKGLLVLMILAAAYMGGFLMDLIITKSFASTIR